MKIELSPIQTEHLLAAVAAGRFPSPEAAIEQAIAALAVMEDEDRLRAQIAAGEKDIAAGRVIDVSGPGSLIEKLKAERSAS